MHLFNKARITALIVLLPLAFFIIPGLLGYGWSAAGSVRLMNGDEYPHNRPLAPGFSITSEPWGAAVISVPFNARVKNAVSNAEWPLWNPYQALGQPFAAQGEGSPYNPVSVIRALIPDQAHNLFALLLIFMSLIFMRALCMLLGMSAAVSVFVASAWAISPALTWHIHRFNYFDQYILIPVFFWALAKAIQAKDRFPWLQTSLIIGWFLIGGFPPAATLIFFVGYLFCITYILAAKEKGGALVSILSITASFVIGGALAAFFLLPCQEIIQNGYYKNSALTYTLPLDFRRLFSFLFPGSLDAPGRLALIWNDTFAAVGFIPLVIALLPLPFNAWKSKNDQKIYLFFILAAAILFLRSFNFPPFDVLNAIPVLGMLTPKHAQSFIVFLLLVATGFSLQNIASRQGSGTFQVAAIFIFFIMIVAQNAVRLQSGHGSPIQPDLTVMYYLALVMVLAVLLALILRRPSESIDTTRLVQALTLLVVAELSFYLLLGVEERYFKYKLVIALLLSSSGLLWFKKFNRSAIVLVCTALSVYALLIARPLNGLPELVKISHTPEFTRVLTDNESRINYRTFGIMPDFSSLVRVQDISTVSAFNTLEFNAFVKLIGNADENTLFYYANSFFSLGFRIPYDLNNYLHHKPVFDWFGVRHIVLDAALFGKGAGLGTRNDHANLVNDKLNFRVVYSDQLATVVESLAAQPKVAFSSQFEIVRSRAEIFRRLLRDPKLINEAPMIESAQAVQQGISKSIGTSYQVDYAMLEKLTDNRLSFKINAKSPGLIVVRDSYYPGWRARLNGVEYPVIRVNGIARGIFVPSAGQYEVEMWYLPESFRLGLWLALGALSSLICASMLLRKGGVWPVRCGRLLILLIVACTLGIYGKAMTGSRLTSPPDVSIEPKEVFTGFDLRSAGPLEFRSVPPTDNRTLVLVSTAQSHFPIADIAPSPLPLVSGDVFIDAAGNLVEVDADSTLVHMRPARGTRICILDSTVRGQNHFETTTLPLAVRSVLRYSGSEWIPDTDIAPDSKLCDLTRTTGRIRFGWLSR